MVSGGMTTDQQALITAKLMRCLPFSVCLFVCQQDYTEATGQREGKKSLKTLTSFDEMKQVFVLETNTQTIV